ncbi:hypothetical protein V2A60_006020 [Cordyceps javanica]|uniref:Transmembrane protein n=1 Tax=Cordyceps javanica TaxID=43265 RepID=A0A545VQ20_9HYPO|nr:hypothetical protein IF1G_09464 [Cordyceps javanica]TQW03827.1 hypothetical protein IF2G_08656 [Cordyceps javanica]
MPRPSTLFTTTTLPFALALAVAVTAAPPPPPLAARDDESANRAIERLGGGGPGAQSAVRGFFIGVAFGVALALLCCCWRPCLALGSARRRYELRLLWWEMGGIREGPPPSPPLSREAAREARTAAAAAADVVLTDTRPQDAPLPAPPERTGPSLPPSPGMAPPTTTLMARATGSGA